MNVDFNKIITSSNSTFRYLEQNKREVISQTLGSICNGNIGIITDDVKYTDSGVFDMTITINGKNLDPTLFLESLYFTLSDKWDKISEFKNVFQAKNASNAKLQKAIEQLNSIKVQFNNVENVLLEISKNVYKNPE